MGDRRFVEQRTYTIQRLTEKHHQILREVSAGKRAREIAAACGVSITTVSNVRNSPVGKAHLAILCQELDAACIRLRQEQWSKPRLPKRAGRDDVCCGWCTASGECQAL